MSHQPSSSLPGASGRAPTTLSSGQALTYYEILGPLGVGGMGEVYRARDTRLEREIAIKVLPDELAGDEDRLRRFEREAKTLASLSHPNVAHVYGIDQVDDTCFMAMELVQGEDLASRLEQGALPVHEALDVCRQIAEGLEAAHEAGVVHRDLKPANVRITPDDLVKVLDFGLAKPMNAKANSDGTTTAAESDSFLMTGEGVVLGTPTYMSPEQARARAIDRRTDVWSFGCVLYECLTGTRAFDGDTLPDVMAAVVGQDPDWSKLPALPPRVTELLRRALDKDPRKRLRDMGEARMQLLLAASDPASGGPAPATGSSPSAIGGRGGSRRIGLRIAALTLAGTAGGFLLGWFLGQSTLAVDTDASSQERRERRDFKFVLHEFGEGDRTRDLKISPAGTHIAWSNADGLHVRSVSELEARTVFDDPVDDFAWAPDGTELAYAIEEALARLPVNGGPFSTIVRHLEDVNSMAWHGDLIYFTDEKGVYSVPVDGGQIEPRAQLGEEISDLHGFDVLPGDGSIVAVLHRVGSAADTIARYENDGWEPVHTVPDSNLSQLSTTPGGSIVFHEFGDGPATWMLPADGTAPRGFGPPVSLSADIRELSVAADGTCAYVLDDKDLSRQQPTWLALDGTTTPIGEPQEGALMARLTPGRRGFLYVAGKGFRSLRIYSHDLERGLSTPIIKLDSPGLPVPLPDGRIAVNLVMNGRGSLVYSASGKGEPESLRDDFLMCTAPDASAWIWTDRGWGAGSAYWTTSPDAEEELPLFENDETCQFVSFSKDGQWILYGSDRADEQQVYLTRFPPEENQDWPVSARRANHAWFAEDGRSIVFTDDYKSPSVYRVSLTLEPEVQLGTPELLFEAPQGSMITDFDGERFLGTIGEPPSERQVVLSTEWRDTLR